MRLNSWIFICLIAVWAAVFAIPDNRLRLIFCDVGQGDAILIQKGTNQFLVDTGPGKSVIECISRHMPFFDRRIEGVLLTHDNADHTGGLKYLLERYSLLQIERDMVKGQQIKIGDAKINILWPESNMNRNENEQGVVGFLDFGDFEALLTADVSSAHYPVVTSLEVAKIPHHGSKTGWKPDWWRQNFPKLAVLSVGKNSFGHPSPEVLGTMTEAGIELKRTDEDGDVVIVTDGITWKVE